MMIDLAVSEYVKQLRRAGAQPSERLTRHILQAGLASLGPLLDLALDTDLLHEDEPECFAPLHALRLLGELGSAEIVEPIIGAYPVIQEYPDERLPIMWADEGSQMIGRLGAAAVEPLWEIADDSSWNSINRGVALLALVYATRVAPEIREQVVDGLLERLPNSDDPEMTAHLVSSMASLGVASVYKQIMDLYRQGRVDQSIIPPGAARQLLLAEPGTRLDCVLHPLNERYEAHGPYEGESEV
jgi:hypothetical protein